MRIYGDWGVPNLSPSDDFVGASYNIDVVGYHVFQSTGIIEMTGGLGGHPKPAM